MSGRDVNRADGATVESVLPIIDLIDWDAEINGNASCHQRAPTIWVVELNGLIKRFASLHLFQSSKYLNKLIPLLFCYWQKREI